MNSLKQIAKAIKKAKSIALFTHINPDLDAFASSMSLMYSFRENNKIANLFVSESIPERDCEILNEKDIICGECNYNEYDLLISTDTPSINRLGDFSQGFISHKNTIVLDHHVSSDLIGKYNYVDSSSSSCSEISLKLLQTLRYKISPDIATLLYAGLSTDTNSFINTNVTKESFRAAFELKSLGANTNSINVHLYKHKSLKSIEFNKFLWNNYLIEKDCAYIIVSLEDLVKLNGSKIDCESFSSSLITIKDINYSFSLIETERGKFSLSLRSKEGYDVNKIAVKLGGGGHLCAAGATIIDVDITNAKYKVLNIIKSNQ